ncbi:MFS transporter [Acinetobacter sp. YH12023]|uniref:MFS transporter n=1 Tax=Acinetobacter sp. YH12023 TaxID=2601041 RepID=UPI00211F2568|nr:MFS transporter [Acinetobacter sp. YH12023]
MLSNRLDLQSADVAASGVSANFDLDKSSLGLFFSAAILGLLPGGLIGGRLGDRIGRKKVLVISIAFGYSRKHTRHYMERCGGFYTLAVYEC